MTIGHIPVSPRHGVTVEQRAGPNLFYPLPRPIKKCLAAGPRFWLKTGTHNPSISRIFSPFPHRKSQFGKGPAGPCPKGSPVSAPPAICSSLRWQRGLKSWAVDPWWIFIPFPAENATAVRPTSQHPRDLGIGFCPGSADKFEPLKGQGALPLESRFGVGIDRQTSIRNFCWKLKALNAKSQPPRPQSF